MIRNLLFLVLTCTVMACSKTYVPVKEVRNDGGKLFFTENYIPLERAENLKCVLSHYGEDFKEGDKAILVPENLMKDIELIYNYQSKSMDSKWLESHNCK